MQNQEPLKKKYAKVYLVVALLNAVFTGLFCYAHCTGMVILSAVTILVYIIFSIMARKVKKLGYVFLACYFMIIIYSTVPTLMIGWECGFLLHLLAILPLVFYSVYLFRNMNMRFAIRYSAFTVLIYFVVLCISFTKLTQIYHLSTFMVHLLLLINTLAAFAIILGFMLAFFSKVKDERIELVQENSQLETSAKYDPLTKLLNRRAFSEYIGRSLIRARTSGSSFSLLMCDIDDFKLVNDNYGHECGDLVLINVSQVLKNVLRDRDHVFRWGGEEILVLIDDDGENTLIVAERLRNAVENMHIHYHDQVIKITLTIGVCKYFDGATADEMINTADRNMYQGKRSGKNQVVM